MKKLTILLTSVTILLSSCNSTDSRTERFLKDPVGNSEELTLDEWRSQALKFANGYLPGVEAIEYQRQTMYYLIDEAYDHQRKFNWQAEFEPFSCCNRDTTDKAYIENYINAIITVRESYQAVYKYCSDQARRLHGVTLTRLDIDKAVNQALVEINAMEDSNKEIPVFEIATQATRDEIKRGNRAAYLLGQEFGSEIRNIININWTPVLVTLSEPEKGKTKIFCWNNYSTETIDQDYTDFTVNHVLDPRFEAIY